MLIFLFFLLINPINSQYNPYFADYTPYTYPDSLTQAYLCRPDEENESKPSLFCDPNHIVYRDRDDLENNTTLPEAGMLTDLDKELKLVRESTNCSCPVRDMCKPFHKGFTISVTVVAKMRLEDNETISRSEVFEAAKKFADTVRDRQQRGQCDDDILIFLSVKDKALWTSIGSVVPINPSQIQQINEEGNIFFKKMEYEQGFIWMIRQYRRILNGQKTEKLWSWPIPEWSVYVLISFILIILASITCSIVYVCVKLCQKDRKAEYSVVGQS